MCCDLLDFRTSLLGVSLGKSQFHWSFSQHIASSQWLNEVGGKAVGSFSVEQGIAGEWTLRRL